MTELNFSLSETTGKIKIMNAVNNGPTDPGVRATYTNFESYKAAKIPYARNHDASFFVGYGGEHTVDVHRIFKDFDADENDPESYIFEPTDQYIKTTLDAGTKIFYRLGASIEHRYKYGTRVPKNMEKWARICEHIIRHYNEGWAKGFRYGIDYWEIWNEPDLFIESGSSPTWQGTRKEFFDLYCISAKHLKSCFPSVKIGGPAICNAWDNLNDGKSFMRAFLDYVKAENAPLDFFSYHWYGKELPMLGETVELVKKELLERGFDKTETVLNEWNYIKGWKGDEWNYSLEMEKGLKGSSFVAGAMCICQALPLDMLMYYDARPCGMNGIFKATTYECLKSYYSFIMFSHLRQLGNYVKCDFVKDDIYSAAATDGKNSAVMLTYYSENDASETKTVKACFDNIKKPLKADIYLLDEDNDLELVSEQYFTAEKFNIILKMKVHSSVLIKLTEI